MIRIYTEIRVPTPPGAAGYIPRVDEFIDYIVTGKEALGSPQDARTALEVCLAVMHP